jgi:hypothetical protein
LLTAISDGLFVRAGPAGLTARGIDALDRTVPVGSHAEHRSLEWDEREDGDHEEQVGNLLAHDAAARRLSNSS